MVATAVKFTSKASGPYLVSPEFSRNVSFSKNPMDALPTARTYTKSPNSTCQGSDRLRSVAGPPGKKNVPNPYIH
uniref:Uncharacterized protein n=1 Tax=Rhizophora mucronata TaxID=61149 RepID=A0A2P2MDV5_RHIMU